MEQTELIIKYTKQIAKDEGFDVNVKFINLYCSGKKSTLGTCNKGKNRIRFNLVYSVPYKYYKQIYPKLNIWETMLHEICHLKDNKWIQCRAYRLSDLKKNEYIDWTHNIDFWKRLRVMRRKYAKLKKEFFENVQQN